MQASQYCDYNVHLSLKASWHAYITLAHLIIPLGNRSLQAVMQVRAISSELFYADACAQVSAAHASRTLSL